MSDKSKIYDYIKRTINPYGRPFKGTAYEFGLKIMDYIENMDDEKENGWIPCSDRLPRPKGDSCWARCIVSVMRSHYPTSTYDICDAPYDEEYVMYANYDAEQKIWHLDSDEQVNALISIEDAPLSGDCVIAWMPLPEPYKEG